MIVQKQNETLVIQAPAKLNLHLEILGKREDGFHELETLMVSISLYDTLTFRSQPSGISVRCSDTDVGAAEDNLVTRAVRLVQQQSGRTEGIAIDLEKRIPVAAGLAGGSSDAAATLMALNQLWQLGWSTDRLAELSGQLGSDIPFFFYAPAAVCRGRGEIVTACAIPEPLHAVVISPEQGLSTAGVFSRVVLPETPVSVDPIVDALEQGDVKQVAQRLHNRLEEASLSLCPAVAQLKQLAQGWDCAGHLMSGSGSSYFALCSSAEQALTLGKSLTELEQARVFVVQSSH